MGKEIAYPPDHRLGMKVPVGGSSCAKCQFLRDGRCVNETFVGWNGSGELPQLPGRYCCDLFRPTDGWADEDWWIDDWEVLPCIVPGCQEKIHVDLADEEYITEPHGDEPAINPDFTEADNWLHDQVQKDHESYLADHTIVISKLCAGDPKKYEKLKGHELAEVLAEAHGMPYDPAHEEVANPVEEEIGVALRHRSPRLGKWR